MKKTSKSKTVDVAVIQRRQPFTLDEVADKLRSFNTCAEMLEWAIKEYGDNLGTPAQIEKLRAAMQKGLTNGLARMRIGNLCRGAITRNQRAVATLNRKIEKVGEMLKDVQETKAKAVGKGTTKVTAAARRKAGVSFVATPPEVAAVRNIRSRFK